MILGGEQALNAAETLDSGDLAHGVGFSKKKRGWSFRGCSR